MIVVIYDVPSNRVRLKIADVCLDYGLRRIQRSAFTGRLGAAHQAELMTKIKRAAGDDPADVRLFSLCERDERNVRVHSTLASETDTSSPKARKPVLATNVASATPGDRKRTTRK